MQYIQGTRYNNHVLLEIVYIFFILLFYLLIFENLFLEHMAMLC